MDVRFLNFKIITYSLLCGSFLMGWSGNARSDSCVEEKLEGLTQNRISPQNLPVLNRTLNQLKAKVFDLKRLKATILIINPTDSLGYSKLTGILRKDGDYLYAIDRDGRIAVIPRVLDPGVEAMKSPDAQYVGSHEGLNLLLSNITGKPAQFVASGEIKIRGGSVMVLSNASGTYRSGAEALAFAKSYLQESGLPMDRAQFWDYSERVNGQLKYGDPHGSVENQVRAGLKRMRDPAFRVLFQRTRQVLNHLAQVPGSKKIILKRLTENVLLSKQLEKSSSHPTPELNRLKEEANLLLLGKQFLDEWTRPIDTETALVDRYLETIGSETTFRKALRRMQEVVDSSVAPPPTQR